MSPLLRRSIGAVADCDLGLEELAELRRPVAARAAARIAHRGITGDEDRRHCVVLHDFHGRKGRPGAGKLDGELIVPAARLGLAGPHAGATVRDRPGTEDELECNLLGGWRRQGLILGSLGAKWRDQAKQRRAERD